MENENNVEVTETTAETVGSWQLKGRLHSKVLWAAIAGLVVAVFSAFGLWDKLGITSEAFNGIMTAAGAVLAAFGVFNNPTDQEGF